MSGSKVVKIDISKNSSSPPDIDSDFGDKSRIISYLISKYGEDHVVSVGTTGYYSLKSAIRSLTPLFSVPGDRKSAVSKIFNENLTIEENMEESEIIASFFHDYPEIKERAPHLVGCIDSWGKHAGGIVILDKRFPASKFFPLRRNNDSENDDRMVAMTTFCDKDELEFLGGVKIDILGLNTCVQVHHCKELTGFDPYKLYEQDIKKVYEDIVGNLKFRNIFQFSSNQGEKALQDIRPMSLVDLSGASAVIRLTVSDVGREFYDLFVTNINKFQEGDTKYWERELAYDIHDRYNLEACKIILKDSYGVLIYQEQLISMIQILSKGAKTYQDGNDVRKLLDKKINQKYGSIDQVLQSPREVQKKWHKDIMEILNEYLLPYIGKDGYDNPDPVVRAFLNCKFEENETLVIPKRGIVGMVVSCSAYLFSILHARAYSMTTYEQMYQKHFHEKEFWLSALNEGEKDKINSYIRGMMLESNLKVLPPNINKSGTKFTFEGDAIRFGLQFVSTMNKSSVDIVIEREANGEFKSVLDFIQRTQKYSSINKRTNQNLVYSNAFVGIPLEHDVGTTADGSNLEKVVALFQKHTTAFTGESYYFYEDDASLTEFTALQTNISFHHSLLRELDQTISVEEIEDGDAEHVIVRVEDVKEKKSKKGKMHKVIDITCLKSQKEYKIYCWFLDYQVKKGDVRYMKIQSRDGFYNIAGGKRW